MQSPREMLDLTGRVVAVTGAGGTLGAGIAQRLAAAGANVLLHTREASVAALAASLPTESAVVGCDLNSPSGPATVVQRALEVFTRLDAVVNNAGIQPVAELATVADEDFRLMLETNVVSVHRLTQAAVAHMREHGGGSIVHIGSIEGSQPAPGHGHYAASKAAVTMHAQAAALEYGKDGVRVNVVSPGLIHRPGIEEQWPEGVERWQRAAPLGRLGTSEDVGDACVFLVSPLARWISGVNLVVDGGVLSRPTW